MILTTKHTVNDDWISFTTTAIRCVKKRKHIWMKTFCSKAPITDRESSAAKLSWFIRQPLVKACSMLKNEAIGFLILFGSPPTNQYNLTVNIRQMCNRICRFSDNILHHLIHKRNIKHQFSADKILHMLHSKFTLLQHSRGESRIWQRGRTMNSVDYKW